MIWKPEDFAERTAKRCTPGLSFDGISTLWYFVIHTRVVGASAASAVVSDAAEKTVVDRLSESTPTASRRSADGCFTVVVPLDSGRVPRSDATSLDTVLA